MCNENKVKIVAVTWSTERKSWNNQRWHAFGLCHIAGLEKEMSAILNLQVALRLHS